MQLDSLNFLIDTQLPPVLAAFLTRKGFATIHTSRVKEGGEFMSDLQITFSQKGHRQKFFNCNWEILKIMN
jgi:hypothetical protein